MSQSELDIFDQHDKEVAKVIAAIKTLSSEPVAQTYSKKPPLVSIADTMRDIDPMFFRDMLAAMKKIEQDNPVKPGVSYVPRN